MIRTLISRRSYVDRGVDAEESLERIARGYRSQVGLGDEGVVEEDRHVITRQEQVFGVVGHLSSFSYVTPSKEIPPETKTRSHQRAVNRGWVEDMLPPTILTRSDANEVVIAATN